MDLGLSMNSQLEDSNLDQSKGEFLKANRRPNRAVWMVAVGAGEPKQLEKTVAFVGAAPACDIMLTSQRAPWIAGVLIRSTNRVEFVPTHESSAHLASCLLPGGSLNCLGEIIKVDFDSTSHRDRPWPVVIILAANRIAKVLLNQPAATLGTGTPSLIRVPSQLVQPCNLVLIPEDESLLIYALPRAGNNLIQQLPLKVGEKLSFKDIRIALLKFESPTMVPESAEAKQLAAPAKRSLLQVVEAVKTQPLKFDSPATSFRPQGSQQQVSAGSVVFEAEGHSDHLALKVRDVFSSREAERYRLRNKVWLIIGLALTLTALYFAWQLFKHLRPFL
jgi:hypothetical protein